MLEMGLDDDAFLPSLVGQSTVISDQLARPELAALRRSAVRGAAAAWQRQKPFPPERAFHRPCSSWRKAEILVRQAPSYPEPLVLATLLAVRDYTSTQGVDDVCLALAPSESVLRQHDLFDERFSTPRWDDVDGGHSQALHQFLVFVAVRLVASLGSLFRLRLPYPRSRASLYFYGELRRASAVTGLEIDPVDEAPEHNKGPWSYLQCLRGADYVRNPVRFHSQIVYGLSLIDPDTVYRHLLRVASIRCSGSKTPREARGYAALGAMRLLGRMQRRRRLLQRLAGIAFENCARQHRALVCYEVAANLCREAADRWFTDANLWISKGTGTLADAPSPIRHVYEIKLLNATALRFYRLRDFRAAQRTLDGALSRVEALARVDHRIADWARPIIFTNYARLMERGFSARSHALTFWRAVENAGDSAQVEQSRLEQAKLHIRAGHARHAFELLQTYCGNDKYASIYLDSELESRWLHMLCGLRTGLRLRKNYQLTRLAELAWWLRRSDLMVKYAS